MTKCQHAGRTDFFFVVSKPNQPAKPRKPNLCCPCRLSVAPPQSEITFQFPDKITEAVITKAIPAFCFPEADELQKSLDKLPKEFVPHFLNVFSTISTCLHLDMFLSM
jgi:hypothetical protein